MSANIPGVVHPLKIFTVFEYPVPIAVPPAFTMVPLHPHDAFTAPAVAVFKATNPPPFPFK